MSTLNDIMGRFIGANWRTSVTGIASAVLGLTTICSTLLAVVKPDSKLAVWIAGISAILTFVARVLTSLATADAANTGLSTANPTPPVPPATAATPTQEQGKP